ncbi:acetoin utilization protein AcuC [Streptomyces sp. RFCAC02]|uniref:acetoin utilization protein AcuC n=1 Tax=Streptomyces sp. RFCAC02 TaxID=2499143 RepID=UPI0010209291|nr:acetoin utilization protein AcuC [Streptomyces sp. RFCAC02]
MSARATRLMWDQGLLAYDFGPGHPMAPLRLDLTRRLVAAFGLDSRLDVASAPAATDELLLAVHDPAYLEAVRAAGDRPGGADPAFGLGTEDNPAFAGMHEAAALITGQTVAAMAAVWNGDTPHAVNFAGGLHHARRAAAAGFCVYNDPAVGIAHLLDLGAERVAYVDVDAHHGDGVQDAFWDDPRVLTVSVHEHPRTLFPGTGLPSETGGAAADGTAVNVALPAGTSDNDWLRALQATVPEVLAAFRPQILVSQHGADTHFEDWQSNLTLSLDAQRAAADLCHTWAHTHAGGQWVALGGGGYQVVDVVPRAWTHLVAIAAHAPIEPAAAVPEEWLAGVYARTRQPGPRRMTDGRTPAPRAWEAGYDPADPVDRAVRATRAAVYPAHGLLP